MPFSFTTLRFWLCSLAKVLFRYCNKDGVFSDLSPVWNDMAFLQEYSLILIWPSHALKFILQLTEHYFRTGTTLPDWAQLSVSSFWCNYNSVLGSSLFFFSPLVILIYCHSLICSLPPNLYLQPKSLSWIPDLYAYLPIQHLYVDANRHENTSKTYTLISPPLPDFLYQ